MKGGIRNLFKGAILLFWYLGPLAKFQNPRTTPSGREVKFSIVGGEEGVSENCSRVQSYSVGN